MNEKFDLTMTNVLPIEDMPDGTTVITLECQPFDIVFHLTASQAEIFRQHIIPPGDRPLRAENDVLWSEIKRLRAVLAEYASQDAWVNGYIWAGNEAEGWWFALRALEDSVRLDVGKYYDPTLYNHEAHEETGHAMRD